MSFTSPETLEVDVRKFDGTMLTGATVTLSTRKVETTSKTLEYRPAPGVDVHHISSGSYVGRDVEPGAYTLTVRHLGLVEQRREIRVEAGGHRELFVLGEAGMDSFQRGPIRVPFQRSNLVVVAFDPAEDVNPGSWAEGNGLVPSDSTPSQAVIESTFLFHVADEKLRENLLLTQVAKDPKVERTGMVVTLDLWKDPDDPDKLQRGTFSYLTDELIVRFHPGTSLETVREVADDFQILRTIPHAPDTYHLKANRPATYEILRLADKLQEHPRVEWAEPNLAGNVELDSPHTPTDALWEECWDRKLIKTREAWDQLAEAGQQRYGDPNLVLAVVDTGIDAKHPDLGGARDSDKIAGLFDFRRMRRDHQYLLGRHGTKVAGVAAALADNPPRDADGKTAGVVGVAPQCRVMGLIYPRTEAEILDMYLWSAGLETNREGWLRPPDRKADIFITSVGFGCCAGAPISGLARSTFEALTTRGREGKGCLLFFSAGNRGRDCTLDRPWAASDEAVGVAASTVLDSVEDLASYSGFGPVELCAPSSDGSLDDDSGSGSTSGRSARYVATTTTGEGYDYSRKFGGTSSATPLAAGVAALVLSARPDLEAGEVRQILRTTTHRIKTDESQTIRLPNGDPRPPRAARFRWLAADGRKARGQKSAIFSRCFGYGRVDANEAVELALRYPRHLALCKSGVRTLRQRARIAATTSALSLSGIQLALAVVFVIAGLTFWWLPSSPNPMQVLLLLLFAFATNHFLQAWLLKWWRQRIRDEHDDPKEDEPLLERDPP